LPVERQNRDALTILTSDPRSVKEAAGELARPCACHGTAARKAVGEAIELQPIGSLARAVSNELDSDTGEVRIIRKQLNAIVDCSNRAAQFMAQTRTE